MLTKELQITLNVAVDEATKRRHEFLTLEHLLFALLHEQTGSDVLRHCGGDLTALERALEAFFAEHVEQMPRYKKHRPEPTAAFERVLQRAVVQAQSSGRNQIDGGHVLAALYQEVKDDEKDD